MDINKLLKGKTKPKPKPEQEVTQEIKQESKPKQKPIIPPMGTQVKECQPIKVNNSSKHSVPASPFAGLKNALSGIKTQQSKPKSKQQPVNPVKQVNHVTIAAKNKIKLQTKPIQKEVQKVSQNVVNKQQEKAQTPQEHKTSLRFDNPELEASAMVQHEELNEMHEAISDDEKELLYTDLTIQLDELANEYSVEVSDVLYQVMDSLASHDFLADMLKPKEIQILVKALERSYASIIKTKVQNRQKDTARKEKVNKVASMLPDFSM